MTTRLLKYALLVLPLLAAHAGAAPAVHPAASCADLPAVGIACTFAFAKYPAPPAAPGKPSGKTYTVHDAGEFNALNGKVKPGDEIILASGTWKNAQLRISAQGAPGHPVLIQAQASGATKLTGASSLTIAGNDIAVSGLAFADGNFTTNGFAAIRLSGCNRCSLDHIAIANYDPAPGAAATIRSFYLLLQGRDITVSNSTFSAKHSAGDFLLANHPANLNLCEPGAACEQHLQILNNVFSGLSRGGHADTEDGKYKIMQIGGENGLLQSFSVIRGNTFQDNDGSNALIDLKTSDIIVQDNKFIANSGRLDIREANRVLVDSNSFDAGSRPGMGGVTVSARDHWIVHNRFSGLSAPADYYHRAVALTDGVSEELGNKAQDYARARNIVIAGNSFANSAAPAIVLGIYPNPGLGRMLTPTGIVIAGNTASGMTARPAKGLVTSDGLVGYIGEPANFSGITLTGNKAN